MFVSLFAKRNIRFRVQCSTLIIYYVVKIDYQNILLTCSKLL